jgi:hypothetical protein
VKAGAADKYTKNRGLNMADTFVQVPPQSTGKKVATVARSSIKYDAATSPFSNGDTVTGANSGVTATITAIVVDTLTAGILYLEEATGTFLNNEVLEVSSAPIATVNTPPIDPQVDFDMQKIAIADPDNPSFVQKIDEFGATVNTFTEGSPQFTAFGQLRVADSTAIADYRSDEGDPSSEFWIRTVSGGSSAHSSTSSVTTLSATTSTGSDCTFTSNRYHKYFPGRGMLAELTVFCGDSGKTGNQRSWGMFDDDNGAFFRLNETSLELVIRSSTSGSVVEIVIPQDEWNSNKADGSGQDLYILDVTTLNLFWIDYQWLGSGKIRFGVYNQLGVRTVLHIENNGNRRPVPWMQSGNIPMRFQTINTGTSASISEINWVCADVKSEGNISPFFSNQSGAEVDSREITDFGVLSATVDTAGSGYAENDVLTISGGTGTSATYTVNTVGGSGEVLTISRTTFGSYSSGSTPTSPAATTVAPAGGTGCILALKITSVPTPVLSIRPTLTINGSVNRHHMIPLELVVYIEGCPAHIQICENTGLIDSTYAAGTISGIDFDTDATGVTSGGKTIYTGTVGIGSHSIDLKPIYDITSGTLRLNSDGVTQDQNIVIIVRGTSATISPVIWAAWQWLEL